MDQLDVTIIGGGMITELQILPSVYQLQRTGVVGEIKVCALNAAPLKVLAENQFLKEAFPGHGFRAFPDFREVAPEANFPELYREVLAGMKKRQCVMVAVPDQLHYPVIKDALAADQHVLTVKPLVLKYQQAVELEKLAHEKGLIVGVEYHKRFDDRSLIARRKYRAGMLGEFRAGHAHLVEPWYYRHSNFPNWCTVENSDAFSYIGCHYVDLVAFITGLKPVEVSVYGQVLPWPNGKRGFLWTDGRVIWENGACLSVLNGFGYPDDGPGGNAQGLYCFFEQGDKGGYLWHHDACRGVKHSHVVKGEAPGETYFNDVNPDYFQLVDKGEGGWTPVGYGFRSIEYIFHACLRAEKASAGLGEAAAREKRRELIDKYDQEGIMATPKNSAYNELVMEAGRLSILHGGRPAVIESGPPPQVRLKREDEFARHQ